MTGQVVSASSSSNKRVKKLRIDRLSALPDCLLISILSLLCTRDAMKTCILSKRWLFLWTGLPELEFKEDSVDDDTRSEFADTVHKALSIWGGNRRLKVSFYYSEWFALDVDAWVKFVIKHKVKDVAFRLKDFIDEEDVRDGRFVWVVGARYYMLPQMMYRNSSLISLSLRGCSMAPRKAIRWGSLSKLCLKRMRLHEDVIQNIFSGCPVLYELSLKHCGGFNCLDVKSPSLRELTLIGWLSYDFDDDYDYEPFLEISAPFIHYVRISVYPKWKLRFTNISSLVRANIDLDRYEYDGKKRLIVYFKELFKKLHHVNDLELGPGFIQALSFLVEKGMRQLPQCGLECLILKTEIVEATTHGIVCLLNSSPHLKTLFISFCYGFSKLCLKKADLNHDLLHLKTVKISVKINNVIEPTLTLVPLLLKRAPVLEKMVIEFTLSPKQYCSSNYIEITQTLLSYPRASTKAQVLVVPVKLSH